jgi:hypothetical protein
VEVDEMFTRELDLGQGRNDVGTSALLLCPI